MHRSHSKKISHSADYLVSQPFLSILFDRYHTCTKNNCFVTNILLQTTNISQLKHIYLRGYLLNNVSTIKDGLVKAIQGNYGFFASAPSAKKEFLNLSHYKCMYDIEEIVIKYTKAKIAFALGKKSPYSKVINLGLVSPYYPKHC